MSVKVEFHVSRSSRDRYQFDEHLFSSSGSVIFASFHAARLFASRINAQTELFKYPEQAVQASDIYAMGLIDEIMHAVVDWYRQKVNPRLMDQALEWLRDRVGATEVDRTLLAFVSEFPTIDHYQGKTTAAQYLEQTTGGVANRLVALEELTMLWLANVNPAQERFRELFDYGNLRQQTAADKVIEHLRRFFKTQPGVGTGHVDLLTLLQQPATSHPLSLQAQLHFMVDNWQEFIGHLSVRLLGGIDFLKEERKARFTGPPPTEVSTYSECDEPEQFSSDWDWMPSLVLMAKSTLVWLDQLARAYDRPISRLDEIPDEELDKLSGWGFTGLWLIGVWQRCNASRQIKRSCGNPEAEASAYSLFDYEIAEEIGGEKALENLRMRCWRRGLRLACDMVPNHTGIDSSWVREHPDWFISLPYSPFPGYSFNSQNLSDDPRYLVQIEDKYYDQSDAAVVFRREDTHTGEVRFIYHGNDGTNMPWNDTAQLDYLNPEVREAVIRKIVHVARMFPVIRFDAAMTLAKKHIQRLWYPEPGRGGDIPSRAEFGMQRKAFDQAIPVEFWREVVDRVASEAPDCLLLAEAFWFMEGYFVRTLGMHRVYNSAFMSMLKNEENFKYRQTIINTLQFNPEVLKRFVNFMNNPDEDSAIAQFGDHDKYFGVCVMLATTPGLPMFGHGQIEGLHEKYGMEYRRAYWDETPNEELVERHEREIFPLLRRRHLFSGVEDFMFYDFLSPSGEVNENVFVYSNRCGGQRTLIVYNNKFEHASGWIRATVPFAQKIAGDPEMRLVQRSLRQGLELTYDDNVFLIFRDDISGLEFLRHSKSVCEQGLYFELGAFKYQVVTTIYEVRDDAQGSFARLTQALNGKGVASIRESLVQQKLGYVLSKFEAVLDLSLLEELMSGDRDDMATALAEFDEKFCDFLTAAAKELGSTTDVAIVRQTVRERIAAWQQLAQPAAFLPELKPNQLKVWNGFAATYLGQRAQRLVFCWLCTHSLGRLGTEPDYEAVSLTMFKDWLLRSRISDLLAQSGSTSTQVTNDLDLLEILVSHHGKLSGETDELTLVLPDVLQDPLVQRFIRVNRFDETTWFDKERAEALTAGLLSVQALVAVESAPPASMARKMIGVCKDAESLSKMFELSGYRFTELLVLLTDASAAVDDRKLKS